MWVDSHCHLDRLEPRETDTGIFLQRAKDAGIEHVLCVGVDEENSKRVVEIAKAYPHVTATVGIHPCDPPTIKDAMGIVARLAQDSCVVGLGETGLDYYRLEPDDMAARHEQIERFRAHIRLARQVKKPLIIHTRQAQVDTLRIMAEENAAEVGGVMHCFTESWAMAEKALTMNFYISISGIVTFKNAGTVQEVAQKTPLDRLLVETDAPYLAPVPHRGKSNEPAFVALVGEKVAELRGMDKQLLAEATTRNFYRLFG